MANCLKCGQEPCVCPAAGNEIPATPQAPAAPTQPQAPEQPGTPPSAQ